MHLFHSAHNAKEVLSVRRQFATVNDWICADLVAPNVSGGGGRGAPCMGFTFLGERLGPSYIFAFHLIPWLNPQFRVES